MKYLRPLVVVLLLATGLTMPVRAADKATETYQKWIEVKEYAKAEAMLVRLLNDRNANPMRRGEYAENLVRVQRLAGRPNDGMKTLGALGKGERELDGVRLEAARCYIALGNLKSADEELQQIKADPNQKIGVLVKYERAQIELKRQQYDACLELCKQISSTVRKMTDELRYDAELRKLLADVESLAREAKNARITQRYGKDYGYYVQARCAQARHDYEGAIKYYKLISCPILIDAAQCYTGQCLVKLGRKAEAVSAYRAFIASQQYGLYRGEALYDLGRLLLAEAQSEAEFRQGLDVIAQAMNWIDTVQQHGDQIDMSAFEAALKEFPPPKETMAADRLGNFHRQLVIPETVVNRLTTSWYLPRLKLEAMLLYAFGLNETGRHDDAVTTIQQLLVLNGSQAGRIVNYDDMPDRLLGDSKDGAFFVPPDIWRSFQSVEGRCLRLGYYFLVAGEYTQAREMFQHVDGATAKNAQDRNVYAGSKLGLACLTFVAGKDSDAVEELTRSDRAFARTSIDPLALTIKANILAGQHGKCYEDAAKLYESVAKRYPNTDYAARALLGWAIAAANTDHLADSRKVAEQLVQRYPKSDFAGAAWTLLSQLPANPAPNSSTAASSTPPAPPAANAAEGAGKIIPFDRHLVIPGDTDVNVQLWQQGMSDILAYKISYSIRAGCGLKNFRLNLTPLEPQVPTTDNAKIAFYRVPAFLLASGKGAGPGSGNR